MSGSVPSAAEARAALREFLLAVAVVTAGALAAAVVAGTVSPASVTSAAAGFEAVPVAMLVGGPAGLAAGFLAATGVDGERFVIAALLVPFVYVVGVEAFVRPEGADHVLLATQLTLGYLLGAALVAVSRRG